MPARIVDCARCERRRTHKGRGLCTSCYDIVRRNDAGNHDITEYPRQYADGQGVVDDWRLLHADRVPDRVIAQRIGISLPALYAALHRARAAGKL